MNKFFKIIIGILIGLGILLILFLIVRDMALNGQLEFKTNLQEYTPRISSLGPERRIEIKENIIVNEEPVYFDVYLPRDFDKIHLEFEYQNKNPEIKIGAMVNDQDMELKPLENFVSEGFVINSVEFDSLANYVNNGKIRFVISIPEIIEPVEIKGLKIKMIRSAIWQENALENIKNYLTFWKNEIK